MSLQGCGSLSAGVQARESCPARQLGHVGASLPCRAPGLQQLLRCRGRLRRLRLRLYDAPGQEHCHR